MQGVEEVGPEFVEDVLRGTGGEESEEGGRRVVLQRLEVTRQHIVNGFNDAESFGGEWGLIEGDEGGAVVLIALVRVGTARNKASVTKGRQKGERKNKLRERDRVLRDKRYPPIKRPSSCRILEVRVVLDDRSLDWLRRSRLRSRLVFVDVVRKGVNG